MAKFDIRSFFEDIASLDKTAESILFTTSDVPYTDIAYASKKLWIEPLESLFSENIIAIKADLTEVISFQEKAYRAYISPLFMLYISTLSFNAFPYTVSEKVFRTFIKKIRSSKTAAESTVIIETFRKKNLDPHEDYTFRQLFRPHHPVHYLLADLAKSVAYTFDVDADLLVRALCPYLHFPQNKIPKETLFALALSAGMSVAEVLSLTEVHKIDDWSVKCNGASRTLLVPATDWLGTWRFIRSCNLPQSVTEKKTTLDIPQKVIGIRLPYKLIPAMHSNLTAAFHGTESLSKSIASFRIFNLSQLSKIATAYSTGTVSDFEIRLQSLPMDVAKMALTVRNHITKDPTFRVTGDKIRELVAAKPPQAKMINDLFWDVYCPLKTGE